jgi:hypothetical protein
MRQIGDRCAQQEIYSECSEQLSDDNRGSDGMPPTRVQALFTYCHGNDDNRCNARSIWEEAAFQERRSPPTQNTIFAL